MGKVATTLEKADITAAQLRDAIALLGRDGVALSAERAAQACDLAREVRKECREKLEEPCKNAALVVREVLVLQICCSAGSPSGVGFEFALEQAFGRQLGPELRSQLHLARSAICRIGWDRLLFERQAPKGLWTHSDSSGAEPAFSCICGLRGLRTPASGEDAAHHQDFQAPIQTKRPIQPC